MEGINIVECPDNVEIDANHKWGRNLLHYKMDYYDYALNAIRDIVDKHKEVSINIRG